MGTVEGTVNDDIIDNNYTLDAEGDVVDGGTGTGPGGGPNDDIVAGGPGEDVISSGVGDDVVFGGADADRIFGGDENDILKGEEGDDLIFAGDGDDTLLGGEDNDTLQADAGNDTLDGGEGEDFLSGGGGRDMLRGGYNDYADGGASDDGIEGNDFDVLDIRGLGDYRLENVTPDSNGNGFDGTVVFLNGNGEATGDKIDFVEIEKILDKDGNRDPVAVDDIATVVTNGSVIIPVLANDSDPDDDTLTVESATTTDGSVEINGDGTLNFVPTPGYTGPAEITYTISDGQGGTDSAIVTVKVTEDKGDNTPPVAVDDAATVDPGDTVDLFPLANDTDADGDEIVLTGVTAPEGSGTVTIGDEGLVQFTPADGVTGDVILTYTISDGQGGTDEGQITVSVNEGNAPPVAVDDGVSVDAGETVDIFPLANDTDADGDEILLTGVTAPEGSGTVVIGPDGLVQFTPADGVTGDVVLSYTISDGQGGTDDGLITVTVNAGETPANSAPVAVDDEAFVTIPGETTRIDVLDNDSDPDGDAIRITSATALMGAVVINDDGTLSYTPNDGAEGPDTITYTITDDISGSDSATVSLVIRDGTVEGTDGDDLIDAGYDGDPNGDFIDNDDAILPGDTGDDDLIYGYGGNDTINAIDGDDEAYGGHGDDVVRGGMGNDTLFGQQGDDELFGGAGDDTVIGGVGNDDLTGGSGDDVLNGGQGNDSILGGSGADTAYGGQGDDYIDTRDPSGEGAFDNPYPGFGAPDAFPDNDRDSVVGGAGNDTIFTGDDRDTIAAGGGDDFVDAGIDNDIVWAGNGNDTVIGAEGEDIIYGGLGNDLIYGGLTPEFDFVNIADDDGDLLPENNRDTIWAGQGDDTVYGQDDDDTIYGQSGNDTLFGGVDNDEIWSGIGDDTAYGGQGDDLIYGQYGEDLLEGGDGDDTIYGGGSNDVIIGGAGNDVLFGGADRDIFIGGNGGDSVNGNQGGDDFDILDLSGVSFDSITYTSADREDGFVTFGDGSVLTFEEIENVIPCFTPGTTIATPRGERLVEDLREGDRIITRDNGIQEVRWVGRKDITGKTLQNSPHLKPVLIKAGSLGNGLPERDMMVSPNHRLLVASDRTQLYFEESEVLAAAKHLIGTPGIHEIDVMNTSYIHFMFDRHEVVLSNGAWTESFQPGDYSLKGIGNAQRNEIVELFPELASSEGIEAYQSARKSLKKHEARLLVR